MRELIGKGGLVLIGVAIAFGQERAVFDVLSVKHAGDMRSQQVAVGPNNWRLNLRPFRYTSGSVSVKESLMTILAEAYQLKPFQIQGPDWLEQEVYEIETRMPEGTSKETARLMMQSALADRLGLQARREQKEFSVFILKALPGSNKLEEVLPTPTTYGYSAGWDHLEAKPAMPLSALASNLSRAAGRPVLDETGLKGYYKVKLQWNVEPSRPDGGADHVGSDAGMISALPQAGLKLEPAKRMMDWLVIEKVAKEPTEN